MLTVDNKPTNTTVRHVCVYCVRSRINSTNSNPKIDEEQNCMANHLAIATRFLCLMYMFSYAYKESCGRSDKRTFTHANTPLSAGGIEEVRGGGVVVVVLVVNNVRACRV